MKEEIIELLKNEDYKARTINELSQYFHMTSTEDYISFIKMMNALEDEGVVIRDSKNNYYLIEQLEYFKGVIVCSSVPFDASIIALNSLG